MTSTARVRRDQSWRLPLARAGLVAKGILYVVLGLLAVGLATGGRSSREVDRSSAVQAMADLPAGQWIVLVVVIGLAALTLWHVVLAFTGDPVRGTEASDKAKYALSAALYALTTAIAFRVLTRVWSIAGGSSGSGSSGSESAAAVLMDLPAGRYVVGVVGIAVIIYAGLQVKQHTADGSFMKRLDVSALDSRAREVVERAGRVGYLARAVVAGLAGLFFVVAAIRQDPEEAGGLSQALATLAGNTLGMIVLWGRVEDHPILGADQVTTSRLIAIDPGLAWARTASRWYRLRMPLSAIEAELAKGEGVPTGILKVKGFTRITDMERLQRLLARYRAQIRKIAEQRGIKHE